MKSTKTFTIDDVLSAATGTLCSRRHMEGVYDIMSHLAGRSLMTHELPAAFQMYSPVLLARYPDLKHADVSGLSAENINARATAWAEQFGETLEIESDPDLWSAQDKGPIGNLLEATQ